MKIQINGKPTEISGSLTVSELLAEKKVEMPDMVSVELNGDILARETFETTRVQADDKLELLYFMGGG
jgi:sulfur carrier protein